MASANETARSFWLGKDTNVYKFVYFMEVNCFSEAEAERCFSYLKLSLGTDRHNLGLETLSNLACTCIHYDVK